MIRTTVLKVVQLKRKASEKYPNAFGPPMHPGLARPAIQIKSANNTDRANQLLMAVTITINKLFRNIQCKKRITLYCPIVEEGKVLREQGGTLSYYTIEFPYISLG
jgi:hypothetical protein